MKAVFLLCAVFVAAHCAVFPERRQVSGCNSFCPMYIIQFCGSDGKTYNSNPCFEKSRLCNEGSNSFADFKSLHFGACNGSENLEPPQTTEAPTTTTA